MFHSSRAPSSVWRGVKHDLAATYKKGEKVWWWAFSSCTKEADALTSQMFLGQTGKRTLFHITCGKAVEIVAYSSFAEAEVLLFPCTWLEVTSKLPHGNGLTISRIPNY